MAFKGSAEAITQLLGGHIDMVTTAAGNVAAHLAEGRLRVIGVSSAQRFPGAFAQVPTWKEQGADIVYGGWRAIMAPKGLTPAQIAYWEGVLKKVTDTPAWKADLEKNFWSDDFVTSAQFGQDLEGVQTLKKYWDEKKPIPWVQIHRVPEHVKFRHNRHVAAGVQCQRCHGPVEQMDKVALTSDTIWWPWLLPSKKLEMGWCIDCHRNNQASQDCLTCHY